MSYKLELLNHHVLAPNLTLSVLVKLNIN